MTGTINLNEPPESYFTRKLDEASNSGLKIIDERSPAHYHYWTMHPDDDKETAALDFGHAFHTAVLEPHTFDSLYCVLPPDAPSRPTIRQINAKKPSPSTIAQIDWWAQWNADHQGQTCLPDDSMEQIRGMANAMRSHVVVIPGGNGKPIKIRVDELLDLCQKEITLRWTDERTGVRCKARADLASEEFSFGGDLKSAIDASPDAFARAVHRYRYHQQHVHYTEGAKACGTPWSNFLFFASEKTKPYVPAVYYIPAMAEERGRVLRDRALDTLARCLKEDRWPGYTETITELNLPAYAYYDAND